jgi:hypothetical protein
MLAITRLGSIVEIREFSYDDIGRLVAVWGVLDGTTQHGIWPIADIVEFVNR